jgi:hypothetical protein
VHFEEHGEGCRRGRFEVRDEVVAVRSRFLTLVLAAEGTKAFLEVRRDSVRMSAGMSVRPIGFTDGRRTSSARVF